MADPSVGDRLREMTELNKAIEAFKAAVGTLSGAASGGGGASVPVILGPITLTTITKHITDVTTLITDSDERIKGGSRPTRRRRPRRKQTRSRH